MKQDREGSRIKVLGSVAVNNIALAILRVVVGSVFMAHGAHKVIVGFGTVSADFAAWGIPAPMGATILVTIVELMFGADLVAGVVTRWATIPLGAVTLVALLKVHLPRGFFLPGGMEYSLVLLAALATIALAGPGSLSVDWIIRTKRKRHKKRANQSGTAGLDSATKRQGL